MAVVGVGGLGGEAGETGRRTIAEDGKEGFGSMCVRRIFASME